MLTEYTNVYFTLKGIILMFAQNDSHLFSKDVGLVDVNVTSSQLIFSKLSIRTSPPWLFTAFDPSVKTPCSDHVTNVRRLAIINTL